MIDELENTIRGNRENFLSVISALLEIRNKQLYKEKGYGRFEVYCYHELGMTSRDFYDAILTFRDAP